jgi:hypothetical protein
LPRIAADIAAHHHCQRYEHPKEQVDRDYKIDEYDPIVHITTHRISFAAPRPSLRAARQTWKVHLRANVYYLLGHTIA